MTVDATVRAREDVCYFVEDGWLSELSGKDFERAVRYRDEFRPDARVVEQRSRIEWRDVA
ncbi:hypothetical protein [Nocardia jiangxiensis]|uniref:hypothetical protein n=1 Tax=Nocardia jiangxiensis TaxID=282685 RepID=UPI0012F63C34|nr:hypothetical protein [Nocardia jiangxiensis]